MRSHATAGFDGRELPLAPRLPQGFHGDLQCRCALSVGRPAAIRVVISSGISPYSERVCAKSIGASLSRSTRFGLQAGYGVALDGLLPLRPETYAGRDRIGTSRVASAEIQAGNRSGPLRLMWRKVKRRVALPWGVGVRGLCLDRSVSGGQRECSTLATTRAGDPERL